MLLRIQIATRAESLQMCAPYTRGKQRLDEAERQLIGIVWTVGLQSQ